MQDFCIERCPNRGAHALLCKNRLWAGLAPLSQDEYHKDVLIRPRSRAGLLRQPFQGGALRIRLSGKSKLN